MTHILRQFGGTDITKMFQYGAAQQDEICKEGVNIILFLLRGDHKRRGNALYGACM